MIKPGQDAFGQEIYACYQGKEVVEIVERDDGFFGASSGPMMYFSEFPDWTPQEQEAMQYVRGRVLDVGAGAGRVALYLQGKGHNVLAIDNSPLALEVCRLRGVKHTSLTSITQVSSKLGRFDTILMLGNNFGLFGNLRRARWLLRRFHKLTSLEAKIIAGSNDIYQTDNPAHLAYHALNRRRGRWPGEVRIRLRYELCKGEWFEYLMVSPGEMEQVLEGSGWKVQRFLKSPERPTYVAVIEKS